MNRLKSSADLVLYVPILPAAVCAPQVTVTLVSAGIANPASVFCEVNGGIQELRMAAYPAIASFRTEQSARSGPSSAAGARPASRPPRMQPCRPPSPPVVVTPPSQGWFGGKVKYVKTLRPHKTSYHLLTIKTADIAYIVMDDRVAMGVTSVWAAQKGAQIALYGLDRWVTDRRAVTTIGGFAAYHGRGFGKWRV